MPAYNTTLPQHPLPTSTTSARFRQAPPLTHIHPRADLTTTAPTPTDTASLAGLTHTWALTTPYYTATVPIWIDEIADAAAWTAEFRKPEAREVVRAVGAWVFVFAKDDARKDEVRETMRGIRGVIEAGAGGLWDGVCLAVGVRNKGMVGTSEKVVGGDGAWGPFEEWDDEARERGFEYVDAEMKGRNEFGEMTGMARVREALEANEWEGGDDDDDDGGLDGLGVGESDDEDWNKTFAAEEAEMGIEMMGLKTELNGGEGADGGEDEAAQVEELERMMSKLSGIRDLAATMPEEQRKKFAAKAVNDLMKSP
ncbi:alpha and gamma adaptin binding protein p34-domain-containing protein [Macrophomina phaseolina]|uniref:Alpha and gamma adaptin binding protein p34-domain-containing protein n=1 Tax=Macrophomina phaseolina TaxID=35725 RepID=A0ABQ8G9X0_9PEZI|nr:alpha and gamma adaptin binding protein p34-domain-containing protein [Macrophomina phaseolina]